MSETPPPEEPQRSAAPIPAPPTTTDRPPTEPPQGGAPAAAGTATASSGLISDVSTKIGIGGLAAVIVGMWLDWASVSAEFMGTEVESSANGYDWGRGWLILTLCAVSAIVLVLRKWQASLILTAIAAVLLVWSIIDIGGAVDVPDSLKDQVDAGTGIGIWLTLAGAIALLYAAWKVKETDNS